MKNEHFLLHTWIRSERKKRNITLVELASATGLAHGQLSRIERGNSNITIFALIRILRAFNMSYKSLIVSGIVQNGIKIPELKSEDKFDYPTFTLGDVENFITFREHTDKTIRKWLAQFLSVKLSWTENEINTLLTEALNLMILPPRSNRTQIGSVIYPQNMDPKILRYNYLSGGALLFFDVGTYIRAFRLERGISLQELGDLIGRSDVGIYNFENGISSRTLFYDVANLDIALETNGELLAIAWRVGELYLGVNRIWTNTKRPVEYTEDQIAWFTRLLVLLRLFQHHRMLDEAENYIEDVRSKSVPNPQ